MPRRFKNNWDMDEIFNNLEDSYELIVPNNKTNSFRSVSTEKYMTMVNEHLRISSNKIYMDKLRETFEKLGELVDEVGSQLLER